MPFFEALTNNYALISYAASIFLFVFYCIFYTEEVIDLCEILVSKIQYINNSINNTITQYVRQIRAKLWVKMIEMDVIDKSKKYKMSPDLHPKDQPYYSPKIKEFSLDTDSFKHRKLSDTEKKIEFQSIEINDTYSIKMFAIVEEK